ncbi:MAG: SUMF1/EgtB/PvdO family nonheme iron enzyme, partial [Flavobacteriales bacterium]|nr:SUMF1/EgtB/PvdO family nonheme iron enzyme [Flavobacteriales bacterium]
MTSKLTFFLLLLGVSSFANNVHFVGEVTVEGKITSAGENNPANYTYINFSIAWENAWRNDIVGTGNAAPYNYDAIWVFAKYRINGGEWKHASIGETGNISEPNTIIDGVSDTRGAFIYSSQNFSGNFTSNNNKLKWFYVNDGVNDSDNIEVELFAIEMVLATEGNYFLGTPVYEIGSFYKYPTREASYEVTSENAIVVGTSSGNLCYTSNQFEDWTNGNAGDRQSIPTSFPKGYNAFYIMKYEITQEQYVSFLNTLTRDQQNYHTQTDVSGTKPKYGRPFVMSKTVSPSFRNGIRVANNFSSSTPLEFYCDLNNNNVANEPNDGQTIACNYLSWADDAAYSDWAGLRPMTELEYEKACRGKDKTPNAWEDAGGVDMYDWWKMTEWVITNPGTPDEVSARSGDVINFWSSRRIGEIHIGGPMRVGCFADGSSNRTDATAGYYGAMNLSDNVYERVITVGNPEG